MVPKHWCKQYRAEKVEADTTSGAMSCNADQAGEEKTA